MVIVFLFSTVYVNIEKTKEIGIGETEKMMKFVDNSKTTVTDYSACLYFSIVTFTTLGYGDLRPVGAARGVAAFKAFVGYLSISLLIGIVVFLLTRKINGLESKNKRINKLPKAGFSF